MNWRRRSTHLTRRSVVIPAFAGSTDRRRPCRRQPIAAIPVPPIHIQGVDLLQVLVRDNNVDQALRILKKKLQREGVLRELKLRRHYEKPSERGDPREGGGDPPRPQAGAQAGDSRGSDRGAEEEAAAAPGAAATVRNAPVVLVLVDLIGRRLGARRIERSSGSPRVAQANCRPADPSRQLAGSRNRRHPELSSPGAPGRLRA